MRSPCTLLRTPWKRSTESVGNSSESEASRHRSPERRGRTLPSRRTDSISKVRRSRPGKSRTPKPESDCAGWCTCAGWSTEPSYLSPGDGWKFYHRPAVAHASRVARALGESLDTWTLRVGRRGPSCSCSLQPAAALLGFGGARDVLQARVSAIQTARSAHTSPRLTRMTARSAAT